MSMLARGGSRLSPAQSVENEQAIRAIQKLPVQLRRVPSRGEFSEQSIEITPALVVEWEFTISDAEPQAVVAVDLGRDVCWIFREKRVLQQALPSAWLCC